MYLISCLKYVWCNIDHYQCATLFQLCNKLTATGRRYGVINRSISERELGNYLLVKYLDCESYALSLFALTASWYAPTRVCWVNSCSSLYICRRRKNRFHRGQEEKKEEIETDARKRGRRGGRDERTDAAKKIEKIPRQMLYRVYEINVETTCNGVVSSIPIIYLLSPQVQRRDAFHMVIFYLFFYGWCTLNRCRNAFLST